MFSYVPLPSVSVKETEVTALFFTKVQEGDQKAGRRRCAGRVWQAGTSSSSHIAKRRLSRLACMGSQPDI